MKEKLKIILKKNIFLYKNLQFFYQFFKNIYLSNFAGSKKDIFRRIYLENKWNDNYSYSGTGSNLEQTKNILEKLPSILLKYDIKSILDIPCGDFFWMKEFDFKGFNYLGGDIVPELIKKNQEKFSNNYINFMILDLTTDQLPSADLIFCRDCLVHLSYRDIFKSLNNIKKSKFKFFMTTNFIDRKFNKNIATGSWRTLNLLKPPFNFPEPVENIDEMCSEANKSYPDKVLSIWKKDSIPFFNI